MLRKILEFPRVLYFAVNEAPWWWKALGWMVVGATLVSVANGC